MAPSSRFRSPGPDRPCSRIAVLIVDDDIAFRHGLAALLRDDEHPVRHYALPHELPPLATLEWVDVLVGAWHLRGGDGLAFADRFHEAHPDRPVVLVAAYRTRTIDAQAAARPFLELLEKPIDYEALHARLHQILR